MGVQPPSSISHHCHPRLGSLEVVSLPGAFVTSTEGPPSVAGAVSVALLQCWWLFCAGSGVAGGPCGGCSVQLLLPLLELGLLQELPAAGTTRIHPALLSSPFPAECRMEMCRGLPMWEWMRWRSPAQPVPEDPHPFSPGIASWLSSGLLCILLHLGIPQRSELESGSVDTATQKWCKSSKSCSPWQLIQGCGTDPAPVLPPSQGRFLGAGEQSHARIPSCLQLLWVSPRQGWGPVRGHGGRVELEGISELILFQPRSTTPRCSKPSLPAGF